MEAFSSMLFPENALLQSNPSMALEICQRLHAYNAKYVFHKKEDKKPLN